MNLPNYFLADLPPGTRVDANLVSEACATLRRNRRRYVLERSTTSIIASLDAVSRQWREPNDPLRRWALAEGPKHLPFGAVTLERGLDALFRRLRGEHLEALVTGELGHLKRLDDWIATRGEQLEQRLGWARGPELLGHITGGVLPDPTLVGMALGLLLRSAQFVKCASGTSFLPRWFGHALYQVDPKLASCLEVAEWRGGTAELDEPFLAAADAVVATGSDETLGHIRARLPVTKRFHGYGHRVSLGYVSREVLTEFGVRPWIEAAAEDVVRWNQLGCLSPHVFYVETGGAVAPEQFAERLAQALAEYEAREPRGPVASEISGSIASRRKFFEVRAAYSPATRLWTSAGSTAWTVVWEEDSMFQMSCLHRFIHVKSVPDLAAALHGAERVRHCVSTVGLAAAPGEGAGMARAWAEWGATRVCPLGRMQDPPVSWRHDGRMPLAEWAIWCDWEQ